MPTLNKSNWGDGPWVGEPDMAFWTDEATGLVCRVVRTGSLGSLCGYVGIPEGHSCYGKVYDEVDVVVHGGLTFAGLQSYGGGRWYFGFDCAHHNDLVPSLEQYLGGQGGVYRTMAYVKNECASLAHQLKGKACA